MDATLQALGGIVLKAIPTLLLVLVLHFYLKRMFFAPMSRVLDERYRATEGARAAAESSLRRAAEKAAEYEAAIRNARAELYQEQEATRKKWRDEQTARVQDARQRAEQQVRQAKEQLAQEVAQARQALAAQSEMLAQQIAARVLERRAS
jgi:F-type H+-transporting ATPase subunit b